MPSLHIQSAAEQVAEYLRAEIRRGRWLGTMPGGGKLAQQLKVGRMTIEEGLKLLEKDGWLVSQGARRPRMIVIPESEGQARSMRIAILPYEQKDVKIDYLIEVRQQLEAAGHVALFSKSLGELRMDPNRVARLVEQTSADAWVVTSGPRTIIDWFAGQPLPTMALFGRGRDSTLAFIGTLKSPAVSEAITQLVEWGHSRIVLLTREDRRKPSPGMLERSFVAALEEHGVRTGPYNLPDWPDNVKGFHQCLDALFRHTPPTALLLDEPSLLIATQQHLARSGIIAPRDVSLMCLESDPVLDWSEPSIAHIQWNSRTLARRVVRWADHVAAGKADTQKTLIKARFISGGSMGPVPRNH